MLKFKKWNCVLLAAVTAICLSVGILLLAPLPEKVANAATTYTISDNAADTVEGTVFLNAADYLNTLNGSTVTKTIYGINAKNGFDPKVDYFHLIIPDNGKYTLIAGGAFQGTNVLSVEFRCGIEMNTVSWGDTKYQKGPFADCIFLDRVVFHETKTVTFKEGAFNGCTSLKEIAFPSWYTNVAEYTFANCSGLETVTFKGTVTNISDKAFLNCSELKFINNTSGVKTIDRKSVV